MESFKKRLIDEVQRYPDLYRNPKKFRTTKEIWRKIAENLNKDIEYCCKTWKHLRDCFVKAKKKGTVNLSPILAKMVWLAPYITTKSKSNGSEVTCAKQTRLSSPSNTDTANSEHTQVNMSPTNGLSDTGGTTSDNPTKPGLRIVLLGKPGAGKSSTGNTILRQEAFDEDFIFDSVSSVSLGKTTEVAGRHITVVDTSGLFDTVRTGDELKREIENCVELSLPGPHVFLLLIRLGVRFTEEDRNAVKWIQEHFGKRALQFTMVLFTHGDILKGKTVESVLTEKVNTLVDSCEGRYHTFNNTEKDQTQVQELLKKIDAMVEENGGEYYTNKMYQEALRKKDRASQEKKSDNLDRPTPNASKVRKRPRMSSPSNAPTANSEHKQAKKPTPNRLSDRDSVAEVEVTGGALDAAASLPGCAAEVEATGGCARVGLRNLSSTSKGRGGAVGDQQCFLGSAGEGKGVNMNASAHTGGIVNAPALNACSISSINVINNFGGAPQQGAPVPQQGGDAYLDSARGEISNFLKKKLKSKVQYITEGNATRQEENPLNKIYTKTQIIEGETIIVNEHEICQRESVVKDQLSHGKEVDFSSIFQQENIRTVLTKGNAGIGKTVCVRKFILDWIEGVANHNIKLMFILPFRELSVLEQLSFHKLLVEFHPELLPFDRADIYDSSATLFILDGLDESGFRLDFSKKTVADMSKSTTVDVLITSLIKGTLLGSALLWITSRPAAVTQAVYEKVNKVTEIRGFSDSQKEEYFRKSVSDPALADIMISHIKSSRVLYIMCHIPLFCWIAKTVFQKILNPEDSNEIPKTLTSMYCHYLLIQANRMNQKKYNENEANIAKLLGCNKEIILKIAQLAFRQFNKNTIFFSEKDLDDCGIRANDPLISEMCSEILKEETFCCMKNFYNKMYYFVHLSIQEFLAAFYALHCYLGKNLSPMKTFLVQTKNKAEFDDLTLDGLLKIAVNKALDSKTGYFDLFVRFLHGLSLESNQKLLGDLLQSERTQADTMKIISNLKKGQQKNNISAERCMNLFHCLSEMNDCSVHEEVQRFLKAEEGSDKTLSLAHCSGLAYMLQLSDEVLETFDLRKYNTSDKGRKMLVPAVKNCRKALLVGCKLTEASCDIVASALQSRNSPLEELDLSDNDLQDSGVKILCSGLKSTSCQLKKLKLSRCGITETGCEALASVLHSNPSSLIELDLSENFPGTKGKHSLKKHKKQCQISFDNEAEYWLKSGLRKYACKITLDPNTAHRQLCQENQKVSATKQEQALPNHPERFQHCQQFLCREGLTGKAYWEVDWKGRTTIGVAYKSIIRDRQDESKLGYNDKSWSLECFVSSCVASHGNSSVTIDVSRSKSGRIGVFLDWQNPGGTLSFYSISSGALCHLHTFHAGFVEPVFPGFMISESVTLRTSQVPTKNPTKGQASDS